MTKPQDVLDFWFPSQPTDQDGMLALLRRHSPPLDDELRSRFGSDVEQALAGAHGDWADSPRGLLALVLLLDQFPRHALRGQGRQHDGDARALALALRALDAGWQEPMAWWERQYLVMPLLHAEDLAVQRRCVEEFEGLRAAAPVWMGWVADLGPDQAIKYLGVIERFGRFPHRNRLLGRTSTDEELDFMKTWPLRQPPYALRERGLLPPQAGIDLGGAAGTDGFVLHAVLPASPERIFDTWVDGDGHAAMTGASATSEPEPGGAFTAWDGYIEGRHLQLRRPDLVRQDWRTSEFADDDPDSRLELDLVPAPGGTLLRLVHGHIPRGQGAAYLQGWEDHYFEPMRRYFAG